MNLPRSRLAFFGALFVWVVAARLPAGAQTGDRSLSWPEVTVDAYLDADGRLHVEERQTMLFDGAWNGGVRSFDLRAGQDLRLEGLTRIDPQSGESFPLREGDLEAVDQYAWSEGVLRWRSRQASDPPFDGDVLIYRIEYVISPVLIPGDERGEYLFSYDFIAPDRAGAIDRFSIELTGDGAWDGQIARGVSESISSLQPSRGYSIIIPVWYVGSGRPAAVAHGAATWARWAGQATAALVPILVLMGLLRRNRELGQAAPITPRDQIDEGWLDANIFALRPEVVGASWDRSVGASEVSALLARLVAEKKLDSQVAEEDGDPVMHLHRLAPLSDFAPFERDLLTRLFFDGGDRTDTTSIREHYQNEGFDPAAEIRAPLMAELDRLPGAGRNRRKWKGPLALLAIGLVAAIIGGGQFGGIQIAVAASVALLAFTAIAVAFAVAFSRRVTHRTGPMIGVLLPVIGTALVLFLVSIGAFEGGSGLLFVRASSTVLVGLAAAVAAIGWLLVRIAAPGQTPERIAFRRKLVSAREFFEWELAQSNPGLQDRWFPYLLAFGLGPHVDRWWKEFGAAAARQPGVVVVPGGGSSSGGGRGWSGGGVQFGGGGGFAGGGAGGSWNVAAAGLASGVSAPNSSSSGGGGSAASGGGSMGGW